MNRLVSSLLFLALGCPADDAMESEAEDGPAETSMASSDSEDGPDLGCAPMGAQEERDTTDGSSNDVMQTFGTPCTTNDECIEILGAGAECLTLAVAYELPGGYCSKPCTLPGEETIVPNAEECDPMGGIDCIGSNSVGFAYCAAACTDDNQCSRDGYVCKLLPTIGAEGDDTLCLMPECCLGEC